MHEEDDTLNFYPIRHNSNEYPKEYNNGSDDLSTFIPDDGPQGETFIPDNI